MSKGKWDKLDTPLVEYIEDFLQWKMARDRADSTLASFRSTLFQLAAFAPLAEAHDLHGADGLRLIVRFLNDKRDKGAAPGTRRRDGSHIKEFTKYLTKLEVIGRDPGPDVPLPAIPAPDPSPIPDRHIDQLLQAASASLRDWLAFLVYLHIGHRKMELGEMRLRDFDLQTGMMTFTRFKPRRTERQPMTEDIRLAVEARYAQGEKPSHYVLYPLRYSNLPGRKGWLPMYEKKPGPGSIHRWWKGLLLRADVPDTKLHHLRHTAGSRFYHATKDAALTQRAMGHKDIRTTFAYYVEPDEAAMVSGREKAAKEGLGR